MIGRRRLLTGALGAGAAAVLHACSSDAASTGGDTTAPSAGAQPPGPTATAPSTPDAVAPPVTSGVYDREALYVALYGHPGASVLGALGEQDAEASVQRAFDLARPYEQFGRRVVPTFEILASVASWEAGRDGDHSNEYGVSHFQAYLDAAAAAGLHVVFDLQTGRARFPDQAREYEALWRFPFTSIALDPEWRVGPTEQPGGGFIGTVDAAEVNETIDYVDGLIRQHQLPPKMCIVHQFTPSMITNKQQIRGTDLVQVVIQMDGFGTLEMKRGSWSRTVADLPAGAFTGWKNFYDEDQPTPTAAETMANEPAPRFVSYQ
ncbi:MAG TPA: hypothetical protein VK917_05370 [Ilumatobacter sp.]|nr:hypothetical protein [Ilumatobacter sp.]